jgi:hypothetical protein
MGCKNGSVRTGARYLHTNTMATLPESFLGRNDATVAEDMLTWLMAHPDAPMAAPPKTKNHRTSPLGHMFLSPKEFDTEHPLFQEVMKRATKADALVKDKDGRTVYDKLMLDIELATDEDAWIKLDIPKARAKAEILKALMQSK